MRAIKTATLVASASFVSLALGGVALADSNATIDGSTGPNSTNTVTVTTTNVNSTDNNNNVYITNVTSQSARSGNASVSDNTMGGSASTGSATNSATTTTDVTLNNMPSVQSAGMPGRGGGTPPITGTSASSEAPTAVLASANTSHGMGGAAPAVTLASATTTLPQAGSSTPMNVSAFRGNVTGSPLDINAVKKANSLTTLALITVGLLSLLGALGSAYYASKRSLRV